MKAPITEQNASPRHPGAEPEEDNVTIQAIKGKGLVATITPHFAVAVIVGLATAFWSRRPDPVSENVGSDARRCNESVTQLRADFTQFKAEYALHNIVQERAVNELLSRIPAFGQPSVQPSSLSQGVSRELSR